MQKQKANCTELQNAVGTWISWARCALWMRLFVVSEPFFLLLFVVGKFTVRSRASEEKKSLPVWLLTPLIVVTFSLVAFVLWLNFSSPSIASENQEVTKVLPPCSAWTQIHNIKPQTCFNCRLFLFCVVCCCLCFRADNPNGVRPHQKSDLPRREARELSGGKTWLQKATHHPHHRLWPGEGIHRSWDKETHPLQRTQESDRNSSIHEHQYTSGKRWVTHVCSMIHTLTTQPIHRTTYRTRVTALRAVFVLDITRL